MTKKKKNSIVGRQLIDGTNQFVNSPIVSSSQAQIALQKLLTHLKAATSHAYILDTVLNDYWLEIQLPLLLPHAMERLKLYVTLSVFIIEKQGVYNYLLVEQFLEEGFGIDMTTNYAHQSPNLINLCLNDSLCIGIVFDEVNKYQLALETIIMKCYEIVLHNEADPQPKSLS